MSWPGERRERQRRVVMRFVVALFAPLGLLYLGIIGVSLLEALSVSCVYSDVNSTKLTMEKIAQRVSIYRIRKEDYPATLELVFLGEPVPLDAWDRPFRYVVSDDRASFDIVSWGADGRIGGTGDATDLRWPDVHAVLRPTTQRSGP